jgi:ketopantoate reductase
MKGKIYLAGAGTIGTAIIAKIASMHTGIVIVSSNDHLKNPFETEPFIIHDNKSIKGESPVFYENEPSKFIGKPKNNFKKR